MLQVSRLCFTGGEMGEKKLFPATALKVMRKFISGGLLCSAGGRAEPRSAFFLKIMPLRFDKLEVGCNRRNYGFCCCSTAGRCEKNR